MAIASVLLYLVAVYVRPGEVVPGWEGYPFAAILGGIAVAVTVLTLFVRPRKFWTEPMDRYVFGFFAAAVASNAAWGWFGGVTLAAEMLLPVIVCYLLLRAAIRTEQHLRWVSYVLTILTVFLAVNGIVQFRNGSSLGAVTAYDVPTEDLDQTGDDQESIRRIRGAGIFNDPNDLAMALVAATPFALGPLLRRRSTVTARTVAATALFPIITALYYTNSRGGFVALAALFIPYLWRTGKVFGTALSMVAVVLVLALGPSRVGQIDSREESAQLRVQSWSEGLQMLKARPLLGVGFSRYTEFNDLVAHNSFVHTLGELGVIGAFFFTGMIFWLFRGNVRPSTAAMSPSTLLDWGDDLRSGSIGLCVCAFFLSRQYNSILFIWLAMGASYSELLKAHSRPEPSKSIARGPAMVGLLTVSGIAAMYLLVRGLALWG